MAKSLVNLTFDNKLPNDVLGRCKETYLIFHCTTVATALLDTSFSLISFPIDSKNEQAFEIFDVNNYLSFSKGYLVFSGFKFLCEIELVSSE